MTPSLVPFFLQKAQVLKEINISPRKPKHTVTFDFPDFHLRRTDSPIWEVRLGFPRDPYSESFKTLKFN